MMLHFHEHRGRARMLDSHEHRGRARMLHLIGLAATVAVLAAACGDDGAAAPAPTTTSAPAASTTSTTVERSTTTAPAATTSTTRAAPASTAAVGDPSGSLPAVAGFRYEEARPSDWPGHWLARSGEDGGAIEYATAGVTVAAVPVHAEDTGGDDGLPDAWVGEVAVIDAGEATADLWSEFVDHHLSGLAVMSGPPVVLDGGTVATAVNIGFSRWEVLGDEAVLAAGDPADTWTGVWYHDGLVWAISGFPSARSYAEQLIALQASSGSEPEPEQTDIDVLEGPLSDLAVDVPGFMYVDAVHGQILEGLDSLGACADRISVHQLHPADDPDPMGSFGDDDVLLNIYVLADLEGCFTGEDLLADVATQGWAEADMLGMPAMTHSDLAPAPGAEEGDWSARAGMIWAGPDGIVVEALTSGPTTLDVYRPVLEAIAAAMAS